MTIIEAQNLSRSFKIYKRKKGFLNNIISLFHREYTIKKAVDNITFTINKGELIGYIGPNGAGKSTTMKMLTGILVPTTGNVFVNGLQPHKNRIKNAAKIGVVFGQRSQLFWDLPVDDTFELYRKMYRIDKNVYKKNREFYIELFEMEDFLNTPVRQLSLGQKMRANLALCLLHDPEILYLDEPTIGLDVVIKKKIREFINTINREKKLTVILTTHDMDDIEQICSRIIMIDKGRLLYDGSLSSFKKKYKPLTMIIADFKEKNVRLDIPGISIIKEMDYRKVFTFNKEKLPVKEIFNRLSTDYNIMDIQIKEESIEDIVSSIYQMS